MSRQDDKEARANQDVGCDRYGAGSHNLEGTCCYALQHKHVTALQETCQRSRPDTVACVRLTSHFSSDRCVRSDMTGMKTGSLASIAAKSLDCEAICRTCTVSLNSTRTPADDTVI